MLRALVPDLITGDNHHYDGNSANISNMASGVSRRPIKVRLYVHQSQGGRVNVFNLMEWPQMEPGELCLVCVHGERLLFLFIFYFFCFCCYLRAIRGQDE